MKKYINVCNFYTLCWCLFLAKGSLYKSDSISVCFYTVIMLMSLYYAGIVFLKYSRNKFVSSYNIIVMMYVIYGLINIFFLGDIYKSGRIIPADMFLQNALRSLLPFYAFYVFAKNGYINIRWLSIWGILFLLLCIPRYYIAEQEMVALIVAKGGTGEEITNNAGYLFTALFPLLCFWERKPVLQYIAFGVCFFFIISAMKRGALLVAVLSMCFFFYHSMKTFSPRQKKIAILCVIVFCALSCVYISIMMETSAYFEQRVEDTIAGNTSNRENLYSSFWHMFWNNGNVMTLLFGHGADATVRYGENYAHNDWLEIAINQGVFGLIIFFVFWKRFYSFLRTTRVYPILYVAVGVCFIQLLSKTIFSMSITDMQIYITIVLGYAIAVMENKRLAYDLIHNRR